MSLPWFAFNIKAYLSDTMRLTTEAHGAYLLLILDYYESEGGPPDDDFILAAIAKLPIEAWQKHRKVLERFFTIEAGHWKHERIEREMLEARLKHAAGIEKSKAGAKAMHEKRRAKEAESPAKPAKPARGSARSMPVAVPQAMPVASPKHAQEHKHPSITEGGEAPPASDDVGIGSQIPRDFLPSPETSDRARAAGMSVDDIDAEVRKFIGAKQADGSLSHDWQGSFAVWIEREIAHRKKQAAKAAPRIEVNNTKFVPTEADWNTAIECFKRNESTWPRWAGNDPSSKCPANILERYGWNNKLKRFMAPEKKAS